MNDIHGSKYTTRGARVIAAQLYVSKGLKRNPPKMIKFIILNRDYFPGITDEMIEQLKLENNVTNEDLAVHDSVQFADIHTETEYEKELIKRAEEYEKMRAKENK